MSTTDQMTPDGTSRIQSALEKLEAMANKQHDIWLRMLHAYESKLYPVDLLATGALKRSAGLCGGFQNMIEQRNFTCAASILRLQLDNALRFYAAFLVADPQAFASAVTDGTPVRKMKDKSGAVMTDAYLVAQLSKRYQWVAKVYETTCGYIHLSERHILQAVESTTDEDLSVGFIMSATDKHLPEETFVEAIEAFCAATEIFHDYMEGWIYSKANPDIMAKIRDAKQKARNAK